MTDVEKLEERVKELSSDQLAEFREWFLQFDAEAWDRQFEADVKAGKLDFLAREAREEKAKGTLKDL